MSLYITHAPESHDSWQIRSDSYWFALISSDKMHVIAIFNNRSVANEFKNTGKCGDCFLVRVSFT